MSAPSPQRWRPLKAVLGGLVDVPEYLEVSDLTQDSRSVTPGAAFLACRGSTYHGVQFAPAAAAAGARAPRPRAPSCGSPHRAYWRLQWTRRSSSERYRTCARSSATSPTASLTR